MSTERIVLVVVTSLLALEGIVLAAAPDEIRNLLNETSPGVLRAAGAAECLLAVLLLALIFFA